jgi:dihydrofolate reductase
MRKVIVAAFVSIDGVMQAPGGPEEDIEGGFEFGGWSFNYWDQVMSEILRKQLSAPYDLLLGRNTYDIFASYWPYAAVDDPIGQKFNAVRKYVATSSPETLVWENSVALEGNVVEAVRALKDSDGVDLLTQGSTKLIQTLIAHDLVDEYRLWVMPLILGKGKRMFGNDGAPKNLKLVSSQSFSTGVCLNILTPDGPVKGGSFAHDEPSLMELERRQKMRIAEGLE